eukprot:2001984-Rhodomonas_salina.3
MEPRVWGKNQVEAQAKLVRASMTRTTVVRRKRQEAFNQWQQGQPNAAVEFEHAWEKIIPSTQRRTDFSSLPGRHKLKEMEPGSARLPCFLCNLTMLQEKTAPGTESYPTGFECTTCALALHPDCHKIFHAEQAKRESKRVLFGYTEGVDKWDSNKWLLSMHTKMREDALLEKHAHSIELARNSQHAASYASAEQQQRWRDVWEEAFKRRKRRAGDGGKHHVAATDSTNACALCAKSCVEYGAGVDEKYETSYRCPVCDVYLHRDCSRAWHRSSGTEDTVHSNRVKYGMHSAEETWDLDAFKKLLLAEHASGGSSTAASRAGSPAAASVTPPVSPKKQANGLATVNDLDSETTDGENGAES